MRSMLGIGDFSRATHLSIKTLRHYHHIGLLTPVAVDATTGYRRYTTDQIPTAQIIRRFRDLDMPLEHIHAVLTAPDSQVRGELISTHLARMEADLARTRDAVAMLRDLLEHPDSLAPIKLRRVEATASAAISEVIDIADALQWYQGALGELDATLASQGATVTRPAGAIYSTALFAEERGQATVFIATAESVRPMGRVEPLVVPAAELATIIHPGSHSDIDRAYGALGAYVSERAVGVDGPIREYYLVGPTDKVNEDAYRTEIGWPIFHTAAPTLTDQRRAT